MENYDSSQGTQNEGAPQQTSYTQPPAPQKKMGKFKASRMLARDSFRLLRKDKEVSLFIILSVIVNLIVLTGLVLFVVFGPLDVPLDEEVTTTLAQDAQTYLVLFVYYLIAYFIATYFQVGLTAVVYERIRGGDLSFGDGMRAATKIIYKIFVWSLIAATVGTIIRIIFDKSQWLGKIVIWAMGAAWNALTFFIAPTLLLDNVSVVQSIKNSGKIFKRTWGETLIMNISLSLFFSILILFVILAYVGAMIVMFTVLSAGTLFVILVSALFAIIILGLLIVSASLSSIFKVVLYEYSVNGRIAEGFTPELVTGAVKKNLKTNINQTQ